MKRIIVLCFLLLVLLDIAPASADPVRECINSVCFTIDEDGELYNVHIENGYTPGNVEIFIPGNKGINSISLWAFIAYKDDLRSVIIPSDVKVIGDQAFENFSKLEEVFFLPVDGGTGLVSIGNYAFSGCTNLHRRSQNDAFTIPETVKSIGKNAFADSGLYSVILEGESPALQIIDDYAFSGCTDLRSIVNISKAVNLKTVGVGAFNGCDNLTTHIPIPYWTYANGVLQIGGQGVFSSPFPWETYSSEIKKVIFLDGVTTIGWDYFDGYSNLKEVQIAETVTDISGSSFSGSGLTSVFIPSSVQHIGSAFYNCTDLKTVSGMNGVSEIGSYAFENSGLTEITIPGNVKTIGEDAFFDCSDLVSVNGMRGVSEIGNRAFAGTGLKSVTIPGNVKKVMGEAFRDCKYLTNVTIEEGVEELGGEVFAMSRNIQSLDLPSSIKSIYAWGVLPVSRLIPITAPKGSYAENWFISHGYKSVNASKYEPSTSITVKDESGRVVNEQEIITNKSTYQLRASALPAGAIQKFYWYFHYSNWYNDGTDSSFANTNGYNGKVKVDITGKVTFEEPATVSIGIYVTDGTSNETYVKLTYDPTYDPNAAAPTPTPESSVQPGNLNGDGVIDIRDLMRLVKILNKEAVEVFCSSDLNGDGTTDIRDLMRLVKYLNKESVELK